MAKKTDSDTVVEMGESVPAELLDPTEAQEQSFVPATRSGALVQGTSIDEFETDNLKKPYLTVAHGVGEAAKAGFDPGQLVLDKEHFIAKKEEPVEMIILSVVQYYKEYMDFTPGIMPRLFANKQEAIKAGMRVKWEDGVGPDCRAAMDITLLLKKPEECNCPLFNINLGTEDEWALCLLSRDKTSHDVMLADLLPVGKKLRTPEGTVMWPRVSWDLFTAQHMFKNGNATWVTRARSKGPIPEEQFNLILSQLG